MDSAFQKNIRALAQKAYSSDRSFFTGFLSLSEIAEYRLMEKELSFVPSALYGGYEGAERAVLRLGGEEDFPITLLCVTPRGAKFSPVLTHRDFLGSVLSVGVERSVIGDIIVKEGAGYIFCLSRMADFIKEELNFVGRLPVSVEVCREKLDGAAKKEKAVFSVSSLRADCIVAGAFKLSRSEAENYFKGGLVYICGKSASPSDKIKEGDAVTVRGKGKFIFVGEEGVSRKGKIIVAVEKFVG